MPKPTTTVQIEVVDKWQDVLEEKLDVLSQLAIIVQLPLHEYSPARSPDQVSSR